MLAKRHKVSQIFTAGTKSAPKVLDNGKKCVKITITSIAREATQFACGTWGNSQVKNPGERSMMALADALRKRETLL